MSIKEGTTPSLPFILEAYALPALLIIGIPFPFYLLIEYKGAEWLDVAFGVAAWVALVGVYWLPMGVVLFRWKGHWLGRLLAGYAASLPLYFLTLALVYPTFGYRFHPRNAAAWGTYFSATPTFYLLALILYFLVRGGRVLAQVVRYGAAAAFLAGLTATTVLWSRVDSYRWPAGPASRFEIVNARIVDTENNRIVEGETVSIENGRILRIGAPTAGWPQLDARGGYLVPGLIDVHVHLQDPVRSVQSGFDLSYFKDSLLGDYAPQRRAYLESGVTSIRSLGEPAAHIFALRRRVASHDLLGPRIFAVGRLVTSPKGHPVSTIWTQQISRQGAILASSLPDLTRGLEENYLGGPPDAIKIVYGTIGQAKEKLSRDLLNQSVAWAKSRRLISVVHAETAAEAADAAASGATGVEHVASVEDLPDSLIAALRDHGTFVDPTFGEFVTGRTLAGDKREEIDRKLRQKYEFVRRLDAAGVRLAVGTDAPLVAYGQGFQDELAHFARAGFTAAQILTIATRNNAAYLGAADELGRVAPGFRADLLLVRGNPLAEIGNLREPDWVIRDGQVVAGTRKESK